MGGITITAELINGLDQGAMGKAIAAMGEQVLDAASRVDKSLASLTLPKLESIKNVVLAGLGGSAIGGDLVRSYLHSSMSVPFYINRTYRLPEFVNEGSLVMVSSYSGTTEETLSMYEAAKAKKAQIVCLATGGTIKEWALRDGYPFVELPSGFQPRAALAYSFVPVLKILEAIGIAPDQTEFLKETASNLESLCATYGADNISDSNDALRLAKILQAKIPVIYSDCEYFDTVNIRWRGQIQENAKHVAFGNVLPEMNHNEINGWDFPLELHKDFQVVFLRSPLDEHARVGLRFSILKEVLKGKGVPVEEVTASGNSPLSRMFSLIILGDWISYYISLLCGVDPSPVPVISLLKSRLAS